MFNGHSSRFPMLILTASKGIKYYDFKSRRDPKSQATFNANGGIFSDGRTTRTIAFDYVYDSRKDLKKALSQERANRPERPDWHFFKMVATRLLERCSRRPLVSSEYKPI